MTATTIEMCPGHTHLEGFGQAAIVNSSRSELRDWYRRWLRPKVMNAAQSGAIDPARAAELERLMNELLAPPAQRPTDIADLKGVSLV